eukprot:scaffold8374_cov175-Amphora_coffeaeformis.AAC.110
MDSGTEAAFCWELERSCVVDSLECTIAAAALFGAYGINGVPIAFVRRVRRSTPSSQSAWRNGVRDLQQSVPSIQNPFTRDFQILKLTTVGKEDETKHRLDPSYR